MLLKQEHSCGHQRAIKSLEEGWVWRSHLAEGMQQTLFKIGCGWWQGEYCLSYGAVGTRVALVASEPITRQAGEWVAVPRNSALIIISEKVKAPFSLNFAHGRCPWFLSTHPNHAATS